MDLPERTFRRWAFRRWAFSAVDPLLSNFFPRPEFTILRCSSASGKFVSSRREKSGKRLKSTRWAEFSDPRRRGPLSTRHRRRRGRTHSNLNDETPQADRSTTSSRDSACPICGGPSFEWGTARGKFRLKFLSDEAGWLKKTFKSGRYTRARMCTECRNVQLFVELDSG